MPEGPEDPVGVRSSRRTFLILGATTASIGSGTYAWFQRSGYAIDPGLLTPAPPRPAVAGLQTPPYDARALTILEWILGALLPGDPAHRLPGALDAGVMDYVVAASTLAGLVPVRNDLLKLTRHLDREFLRTRATRFMTADNSARTAALAEAARDFEPRGRFIPARAVEATLRLALEGYLGHPFHGGNRGAGVWDALSISMPRSRGPSPHRHAPRAF